MITTLIATALFDFDFYYSTSKYHTALRSTAGQGLVLRLRNTSSSLLTARGYQ